MSKKNEFSDLAESVDQKFKEIDKRKEIISKHEKKTQKKDEQDPRIVKFNEQRKLEKFLFKERLVVATVIFILCHILLSPVYMKFPGLSVQIFIFASFSIGTICFAVFDLY